MLPSWTVARLISRTYLPSYVPAIARCITHVLSHSMRSLLSFHYTVLVYSLFDHVSTVDSRRWQRYTWADMRVCRACLGAPLTSLARRSRYDERGKRCTDSYDHLARALEFAISSKHKMGRALGRTLDKLVSRHEVVLGIDVRKKAWRCCLPRVVQGVASYIILFEQLLFQLLGQLIEGGPSISVLRCTSSAFGW